MQVLNLQKTDEGLAYLSGLTKLRFLTLNRSNLTDAGLKHLAALKGLRVLTINKTKVTAEGLKELKEALPLCRVIGP